MWFDLFFVLFFFLISKATTPNETNIDITDVLDGINEDLANMQNTNSTTGSQRAVIGDIEKVKKIAQILETVGQALLPAVLDGQLNAQNSETNSPKASGPSETVKSLPKGLKLLQHHNTLASNLNDALPIQSQSSVGVQIEWYFPFALLFVLIEIS